MKKLILLTICFVSIISSAFSVEDFTIWKVDATVQKFNNVFFAGQNDELIILVCDSILYRMNSSNGKYIDSLYFGKGVLSSTITNDGLKVYVSLWDSIVGYDVYDFSKVVNVPKVPLSGRLINDDMRTAYLDLSVSMSDRYLNCIYAEGNHQSQDLYQVLVYDLESNTLLHRLDYSKNLVNQINIYSNPTMTPDEKTIILITSVSGIGEVVFYDLIKKEFTTRIETKSKLSPQTEFVFLNDNEVTITKSAIPSFYGLNVFNFKSGLIQSLFDFQSGGNRLTPQTLYRVTKDLFLTTLFDYKSDIYSFTFLDVKSRDTSENFYNIQLGAKIDINKLANRFISYSTVDIYLHDLNKYLTLTSVENSPKPDITFSPNPSNNSLRISSKAQQFINYVILDINGKVAIEENTFTNDMIIDISSLSSGVYFIKLTNIDGTTHKEKFVKEGK